MASQALHITPKDRTGDEGTVLVATEGYTVKERCAETLELLCVMRHYCDIGGKSFVRL